MVQGTSSGSGKTTLVAALCRIFSNLGVQVAPFKAQNMSRFTYGKRFRVARAQALQAIAARCDITPDINPILLRPHGDNTSTVYLDGKRHSRMGAARYYGDFVDRRGRASVESALARLKCRYRLLVIEGAGSPAEINIKNDISNMWTAARADARVILVSDVERGGSFASLVGTVSLMGARDRRRIVGTVFNRFRGDPDLLRSGFARLRRLTGVPVLGIIPMMDMDLPAEDSLDGPDKGAWNITQIDKTLDRLAASISLHLDMSRITGLAGVT